MSDSDMTQSRITGKRIRVGGENRVRKIDPVARWGEVEGDSRS